ncbi:LpqB family beta-propeller domain-containing protein [Actinoplanes sp. NPDC024001]|uniref:LpqB family beta-propeller domain-containing protein n=1 Tax=Actinoplanes sp. NPDC024001 TaxID=3154598 RepID=UPI00340860BC
MRRCLPAVTAVVLVLLGGCGIPDETGVVEVGSGPSTGISPGDNDTPVAEATRGTTKDRRDFILNYLEAAAGDYDTAADRARGFMTKSLADQFKPVNSPRVIRVTDDPLDDLNTGRVVVSYEVIGTLDKNGVLEPAAEPQTDQYEFTVAEVSGEPGLFLAKAPELLLLSDTALAEKYAERTIYFWNNKRTSLIPDVRYMARTLPEEQEPNTILSWLIAGPSPWLRDAVELLPEGTATLGKVPAVADDRLQISLNAQAVPTKDAVAALDRLRRQLQWSLRTVVPEHLDLKIGHQETRHYAGKDLDSSNIAHRLATRPERFVVYDGRIVRMADSTNEEEAVPALSAAANKDIRTAAMHSSATHTFVAVVSGRDDALRVGATPFGGEVALQPVTGLPSGRGHPEWAIAPDKTTDGAVGLIIANGRLFSFGARGGAAQAVPVPGVTGKISALSVAPDGHRVAVVADGRLYRAVLTVTGDGVEISDPEQLRPPLQNVTAVAFSSESWLNVAGGRNGRVSIVQVSIDGALDGPNPIEIGSGVVNYLTAYPSNPQSNQYHSNSVSFTTGTAAYDVLSTAVPITVANLAVAPEQPAAGKIPTAPFFMQ